MEYAYTEPTGRDTGKASECVRMRVRNNSSIEPDTHAMVLCLSQWRAAWRRSHLAAKGKGDKLAAVHPAPVVRPQELH
jgi:hypothetical protein